jgi:C4-dicarboxylate transporter, DctM subunit
MMDEGTLVAIVGFIAVIALMLIRVPIGTCLGIVSIVGFGYMTAPWPALSLLIHSPIRTVTNFEFSVIPMFILMGALVSASGMSRELFRAAKAWLGHFPGGMAMATVFACGGFAAINGSSIATAATMITVALPELRSSGYNPGISAGVIAAGGTLGIMIPPSVLFVIYAILTDLDVGSLFIAGILPGLLAIVLYCITIQIICFYRPALLPAGKKADWHERITSMRDVWATLLLFFTVIGGIYAGFVTVVEAAGLGVIGALLIGLARRKLSWPAIVEALVESLRTSASVFMIAIGAFLFQYFLAITQASQLVADFLTHLDLPPMGIMILILVAYLLAMSFIDELAIVLLTVPIIFPIVVQLGFDPIWFGVIIVMTVTIGLVAPPVGIICFIINNMVKDITLMEIYKGVMPFVCADIIRLALLVAFPAISLVLVQAMR